MPVSLMIKLRHLIAAFETRIDITTFWCLALER